MTDLAAMRQRLAETPVCDHSPLAICDTCDLRRVLDAHDDARSLVAEVASGVTHYQGPGGCGDPNPCVRCRAEAAEQERDDLRRTLDLMWAADQRAIRARRPPPAECPERDECLARAGAPIGMYHCTHCGTMLLAGVDPTPMCPRVSGGGEDVP